MKMTKQQKRSRLLERKRDRLLREISTFTGDRGSLGAISNSLDRKRMKTVDRITKNIKKFNKEAKMLHEIRRMGYKELEPKALRRYERAEGEAIKSVLNINREIGAGVQRDYRNQVRHFSTGSSKGKREIMKNFRLTPGNILDRFNNRFFYLENIELFQAASAERKSVNKNRGGKNKPKIKGKIGYGSAVVTLEGEINKKYKEFKKKLKK